MLTEQWTTTERPAQRIHETLQQMWKSSASIFGRCTAERMCFIGEVVNPLKARDPGIYVCAISLAYCYPAVERWRWQWLG